MHTYSCCLIWSNRIVINEIISEYPGCDARERERGEERTHRRWRYQQHGRARYHSQHTGCSYTHHTQLTHVSAPRSPSSLVELHKQETSYPPAPRSTTTSSVVSWMFARARSFRCCVRRTSASGRLDDAKVVAVLRQAVEGALCVVPTPSHRQPTNQRASQASKIDLAVRYLRHIALEVRQIESDGRQRRRHERHEQHDENHT